LEFLKSITLSKHARKIYSAITPYKLGKSDLISFIFFVNYGSNSELLFLFLFWACLIKGLSPIIRGAYTSTQLGSIRVRSLSFSIYSFLIRREGLRLLNNKLVVFAANFVLCVGEIFSHLWFI
jgi:hypothetical protein